MLARIVKGTNEASSNADGFLRRNMRSDVIESADAVKMGIPASAFGIGIEYVVRAAEHVIPRATSGRSRLRLIN